MAVKYVICFLALYAAMLSICSVISIIRARIIRFADYPCKIISCY
jgi:hypothetical protein